MAFKCLTSRVPEYLSSQFTKREEIGSKGWRSGESTRTRHSPWIFDMFILDRIDRELRHSLERLELKFSLSSEFFDKIPVRILLDVLFRVFRFSKASFLP